MNVFDTKPLPHDLDAEMAVLGCLLLDNGLIEKSQRVFGTKDVFYAKKNQAVYEAMVTLTGKGLPVDLVNLRYRLRESECLAADEEYLLSLEDSVGHTASFSYYAGEICKHYNRRKTIEAATRIIEGAYVGDDADASELIPMLENHKTDSSGIVRVSDIEDEVRDLHENGGLPRGVSTGWSSVGQYYTVLPGLLTVITGIPSHGKSTWLTNLLVNLAMRHGWKFALFSPENMPLKRYIAEIVGVYAGKRFNTLLPAELEYSLDWAQSHFVFINPPDGELSVDSIIGKAKFCVEKHGINGLVADPWNEVDHSRPDGMTETEHVSLCLSKLKRFAQTQNVHVWLVAHPTKMQKRPDGTYGVPTAYDISGSANFRNKADVCLCIWRDVLASDGISELHVQKARFREIGKPGMVQLRYNPATGRYDAP